MNNALTSANTQKPDWDDTDWAIWDHIVNRHMSLRATARAVDMSHEGVRYRYRRMCREAAYGDIDRQRTVEGQRLEALAAQAHAVAQEAIACHGAAAALTRVELGIDDPDVPVPVDPKHLETARKALGEVRQIRRDFATLYGLPLDVGDAPAADAERINDLMSAYLKGRDDKEAEARTSG
jgi:hypothetical protein